MERFHRQMVGLGRIQSSWATTWYVIRKGTEFIVR